MFAFYTLHEDEFMAEYHKRSTVETTMHMIKAKFGDSVRAKTERAMIAEVDLKVLCHNICCVITSMFEMGVRPEWSD